MAKLNFLGGQVQLFDNNGDPLAGGKVYFYEPGTSTPKDTYTDSSLGTANANPVVLDANGRASIWLNGNYKVVVTDSAGVTLYTEDNINPAEAASTGGYNFVTNGSFETNTTGDGKTPDGWTLTEYTGATVTLDTTDQQHGAQAIKFTSVGNGGGYIENTDLFEVSPNRDLDISFALKSSVVDVRNVVEIRWYDASQAYLSTTTLLDDSATNPTSWAQKSYTATPPSGARYARLRMYGAHPSDATPGSTWYDDVVVKEASFNITGLAVGTDTAPANDQVPIYDVSAAGNRKVPIDAFVPQGYLYGLTLSNNATDSINDIDIAPGLCRDSSDAYTLRLSSTLTKRLDAAWTAGTGAGGLFSGTKAADAWYHVFLIRKDSDGSIDAGFDTSDTAANIPAGYTAYRRIGSIRTDSAGNIRQFHQRGRMFLFDNPVFDVNGATAASYTEYTVTATVPPSKIGIFSAHVNKGNANQIGISIYSADVTRTLSTVQELDILSGAGDAASNSAKVSGVIQAFVSSSSQIKYQIGSYSSTTVYIKALGWEDVD